MAESDAGPQPTPASKPRKSGIVVPRPLTWRHRLAAFLIAFGVRVISRTWRCKIAFDSDFGDPAEQRIFVFWHNRLALCTVFWQAVSERLEKKQMVALISASHDGGILSHALQSFNIKAVRGSSSRRGAQALLELTSWVERGYHVAITPDGPRGPKYTMRDGVIALSQVTGLPVVPLTAHIAGKLVAKSWDRFQIPLPFARCEIHFGAPVRISRESTDEEREQARQDLERRLMELTRD